MLVITNKQTNIREIGFITDDDLSKLSISKDFVALAQEFAGAFRDADHVWVLDIYAAGEAPIEGVTARNLVERAHALGQRHVEYAPHGLAAAEAAVLAAQPGDTVLTLGAGDVRKLGDHVLAELRRVAVGEEL